MRPMPELEITIARVEELLPYAGNAKLHPHEQVDQIAESISEFGNNDPIAVWHNADGEMEVVEGHGRLMALKKLGMEECPVIFLDHLDDEQRRAYALVHNQLTLNSDFDMDALADELSKISDIDMDAFGLDDLGSMDFMDFDGMGDGGGSRIQNGSHVRIVLGPFICEMKDAEQKYYNLCKDLDEMRVVAAVRMLFDEGFLP